MDSDAFPGPGSGARARPPLVTQKHLETIFNATHDVVMVLDSDTHTIVHVNPTVFRVFGYPPEALVGTKFDALLGGDESARLEDADLVDGVYGPIHVLCADGTRRPADVTVAVIPWDGQPALLYSLRDATERTHLEAERVKLIRELQDALATVKQLSGLLPICASCKRIRDDHGYWATVEQYISTHAGVEFSHGICPSCRDVLYPELGRGGDGAAQVGETG